MAVAVGMVAWSGEPLLLPIALLFPALWAFAPSRIGAVLVSAGYFLAASRGLPQGVANFYDSGFGDGLVLWFGAALAFVMVHAVLWTPRAGTGKAVRYLLAAVLMSVPPFGIVGWAHPVTAAGILFPGWSWLGLLAAVLVIIGMTSRLWPIFAALLSVFWIWAAAAWWVPAQPDGWAAINTKFGGSNGAYASHHQHLETIDYVLAASGDGATLVVLPESALGIWTPTIERLWTHALRDHDVTVYGGAVVVDEIGYDNVMLELTAQGATVRYRQRMPVPVSMWQPWLELFGSPAGARATFFANPIASAQGARVATLICYEQLLVWPMLQSALGSPEVLVAPANGWWTADTDIVAIQIAATTSWARLFNLPLVMAINT